MAIDSLFHGSVQMAEPAIVVLTSNPLTVGRAYPATWNPKPMKSPMQPPDISKASCPADPVPSVPLGSHDGQPSPGQEPVGCLILRFQQSLSPAMIEAVRQQTRPIADSLGLKVLVLEKGTEVEIRYRQDPLLAALFEQTAAINRLASSNEALVQAMAEGEGMADDDDQPGAYLNGSPVR